MICVLAIYGYVYEDSDSLIVDNDTLTICSSHQYAVLVHIRNNAQLFVRSATGATDSTGWLELDAPHINITHSSTLLGSERGHKGGYLNNHPWGYGPGGGSAGGVSGGAGGGGAYGGSGGAGGDIYGGAGGVVYGGLADTLIQMGSGGGAGRLSVVDGAGGNGGASVSLHGTVVEIDSSDILLLGQRGTDGSVEAGGGGSGGGLLIWADTVSLHEVTINATGGNGGDASFGGGGGAGGGRIKILYSAVLDTSSTILFAGGGNAGSGTYGTPQAGMAGTIYIGIHTGIHETVPEPLHTLTVKPNPSQGVMWLQTYRCPTDIHIHDCAGRKVKTISVIRGNEMIDLRDLPPGVYFVSEPPVSHRPSKLIITR